IDASEGREKFHNLPAARKCTDGKPSSNNLSETEEIWRHVKVLRHGTVPEAKPGDDFVEDKEGSDFIAEGAQSLEKLLRRRDNPHIPRNGFEDDAGDVIGIGGNGLSHIVQVVVTADEGMFQSLFGNPEGGRGVV